MDAVITALRDATREAHAALDASIDPEVIFASRERYAEFLGALHGFHSAVDAQLDGATLPGVDPAPARATLLAADLAAIGAPPATRVMPGLPAATDAGARYGLLYVVEGSALGGIVLGRLVRRRLGLGPDDGAGFFNLAAATPGRWQQVKAALEREAGGARLAHAQRAAVGAFAALSDWMLLSGVARPVAVAR